MAKTTRTRKSKESTTPEATTLFVPESPQTQYFNEELIIRGARVHNLKNVDITFPREKLIVITGISGSGKSSLAFDTIYAEGQRRYVESLSPYARQFLDMMERPDVDLIEGLSPAISIEQKTIGNSPRSTVGTVTEVYDFVRLLFARLGTQFCVACDIPVERQTQDQIIGTIFSYPENSKLILLAPLVRARKGHYRELFADSLRAGFTKVRIDGEIKDLVEGLQVDRYKIHTIEVVVDRLPIHAQYMDRLGQSVETALKMGKGVASAVVETKNGEMTELLFSEKYACPNCGRSYEEPQPNTFSFNSVIGACAMCHGLGETKDFDEELLYGDTTKSIEDGALTPLGKKRKNWLWAQVEAVFTAFNADTNTPFNKLKRDLVQTLIHGSGTEKLKIDWHSGSGKKVTYDMRFAGILDTLKQAVKKDATESLREWAQQFMAGRSCPSCGGGRLKQESLFIRIEGRNIHHAVTLSLEEAVDCFKS